jgi:hypothetical protein
MAEVDRPSGGEGEALDEGELRAASLNSRAGNRDALEGLEDAEDAEDGLEGLDDEESTVAAAAAAEAIKARAALAAMTAMDAEGWGGGMGGMVHTMRVVRCGLQPGSGAPAPGLEWRAGGGWPCRVRVAGAQCMRRAPNVSPPPPAPTHPQSSSRRPCWPPASRPTCHAP